MPQSWSRDALPFLHRFLSPIETSQSLSLKSRFLKNSLGQEETVRTGHGTTDWFQEEKEYIKAVYCHPAYLTYMQSTS